MVVITEQSMFHAIYTNITVPLLFHVNVMRQFGRRTFGRKNDLQTPEIAHWV